MHKKSVKLVVFAIIIFIVAIISRQKPITSMVAREQRRFSYIFFQQYNDMCTIAPMLNRYRLQELRRIARGSGQSFVELAFDNPMLALTSQQWFGEGFSYFFSWRKFLTEFMHTEIGKNYLTGVARDGLVTPHFYTQKGASLFESDKAALLKYPFFFADLSSGGEISEEMGTGFFIPLASPLRCLDSSGALRSEVPNERFCLSLVDERTGEDSGWLIYNKETKKFENFSYAKLQNDPVFASIKASLNQYQAYFQHPLPIYFGNLRKEVLGFKSFASISSDWCHGFKENEQSNEKMPYCLGFLKLMFLVLGINNDNETIVPSDIVDVYYPDEFDVHRKMKELIQTDRENNPWSDKFFKKEYFMQYALAEIFKDPANQELYDNAVKTVDIMGKKFWQTYDAITSQPARLVLYKDNQGTAYTRTEFVKYLPGRHQALAYFFTEALRYLWYGATSKNAVAYYKALGMHSKKHPYLGRLGAWWFGINFSKIKSNAEKRIDGVSFLSVWADIKHELQHRYPDNQDWISFDDHGWVISFDQNLIDMQGDIAQEKSCDYEFLDRLGFAGIESWLGHELETFYKR